MDAKGRKDAMSDAPGLGETALIIVLLYLLVAIVLAGDAAAAVRRRLSPGRT